MKRPESGKKPIVVNNRRRQTAGKGKKEQGGQWSGQTSQKQEPGKKRTSPKKGYGERLKAFMAKEKQKVLSLPKEERLVYIWDYYKLWIIGIVAALFLLIYVPYRAFFAVTDYWLYATFAGTTAPAGNGSPMWEDFVEYSGYNTREKQVYFNGASFFDPSKEGGTLGSYFQSFVAATEAGDLDLVTLEEPGLVALGESGRLLDLTGEEAFAPYADRFVTCIPYDEEYSRDPVPVGIDLSDSRLMREYGLYEDSCVLGVSAYTSRKEAVADFIAWALLEGGEE